MKATRKTGSNQQPMTGLTAIREFLPCATPDAWCAWARDNIPTLLIDHANCEKKAAASAMNLMYRYVDRPELLKKMSQLAREELLHFEQVVEMLKGRKIPYSHLSPSRYASSMRALMRSFEPARLVDTLIVGAFVEARSCERFAKLVPLLDEEMARFYNSLLRSESRHFSDYLALARAYAGEDLSGRIASFAQREAELVCSPDVEFRFHSGIPG